MFKKILAPIDGSEAAWNALEAARQLAEKFSGELVVLTVAVPYNSVSLLQVALDQSIMKKNDEEMEKAGKAFLDEAKNRLADFKGKVSYVEETGDAAEVILEEVEDCKADSIVIGSRGLSGIEEFLLGSVSSKVSQFAKVPVFVIK